MKGKELRIIFITDVHDAFEPLRKVLINTDADLYLIAGDIVYSVFPSYTDAWEFIALQEYMQGLKGREGYRGTHLKIAMDILKNGLGGDEGKRKAEDYLRLCEKAEIRLKGKYERLEGIFSNFPEKMIRVLPGNYDMDLSLTALGQRDIHKKSIALGGLKISGYGGAKVFTPGIPDHLTVPFREDIKNGVLESEPYLFFKMERPDIVVLHHPPYGFLDQMPGLGRVGSIGVRNFIDEERVKVVLSGHFHESWGSMYHEGVLFFNPSNFGRFVEVTRVKKGGYFFDFLIDDGGLNVGTLRQLEGERIYDLADYIPRGRELRRLILDDKRINSLRGKRHRESHIRSISRFNKVKNFFLGYETEIARHIIQELRLIYRGLMKKGMRVAFDLLGSLNFGMAEESSDIDLIVYLRGEECDPDPNDVCSIPLPLQAVFDGLKKHNLDIDVCDSLDLDRVERAILDNDLEDGHLQRFIFYRSICRPVNLRLIREVESLLIERPNLRRELESRVREYIRIMVSSFRHSFSFKKYQSRLAEKGIVMPKDISDALMRYLRGT